MPYRPVTVHHKHPSAHVGTPAPGPVSTHLRHQLRQEGGRHTEQLLQQPVAPSQLVGGPGDTGQRVGAVWCALVVGLCVRRVPSTVNRCVANWPS